MARRYHAAHEQVNFAVNRFESSLRTGGLGVDIRGVAVQWMIFSRGISTLSKEVYGTVKVLVAFRVFLALGQTYSSMLKVTTCPTTSPALCIRNRMFCGASSGVPPVGRPRTNRRSAVG